MYSVFLPQCDATSTSAPTTAASPNLPTSPSRGNPSPNRIDTSFALSPSITSLPPIPFDHHLPCSSSLSLAISDLTPSGLGHPSSPFYQFVIGEHAEPAACLENLESPSAGSYIFIDITTCAQSARCGPQEPPQLPTSSFVLGALVALSSSPPRPSSPPTLMLRLEPPLPPLPRALLPHPSWSRPPLVSLLPLRASWVCQRAGWAMEGTGSESIEETCYVHVPACYVHMDIHNRDTTTREIDSEISSEISSIRSEPTAGGLPLDRPCPKGAPVGLDKLSRQAYSLQGQANGGMDVPPCSSRSSPWPAGGGSTTPNRHDVSTPAAPEVDPLDQRGGWSGGTEDDTEETDDTEDADRSMAAASTLMAAVSAIEQLTATVSAAARLAASASAAAPMVAYLTVSSSSTGMRLPVLLLVLLALPRALAVDYQ